MGHSKLQQRYYDPKRVGSYGGVAALRRVVPEQDVERWLSEQDTYTLHKPVRRRFKRRCVVVGGPNQQWQADLVDMSRLKKVNDGTTFILTEKGTAKYPIRPVDCKVYSIPQGAMSHTHENLFLGTLPKRLILWCIDNDAYNGEFSKNPFNAKNNAINFLAVYVDGRQVPAKPLQPNFETGSYIRSYVNLFSATSKQSQDEGNELSRDDFGKCNTFFGFDLTPKVATIVVSI